MNNFNLYSFLLKDLKKSKNDYINNFIVIDKIINKKLFLPVFFFEKKIFSSYLIFKSVLKSLNLTFIFLNSNHKYKNFLKGNNIILLDYKNPKTNLYNLKGDIFKDLILEKNYYNQYFNSAQNFDNFNFFFNYNIYLFNCIEIYKILLILHLKLKT